MNFGNTFIIFAVIIAPISRPVIPVAMVFFFIKLTAVSMINYIVCRIP